MSWQYLGSGNVLQAYDIANLEEAVPDGGKCKLQMDLTAGLPQSVINEIKNQMDEQGIPGAKVYSGSPQLNVEWKKESSVAGVAAVPIALIVVAIIAALVVAALIIGWRFYMDVAATSGPVAATTILIIAGVGVLTLAVLGFLAYQRSRS